MKDLGLILLVASIISGSCAARSATYRSCNEIVQLVSLVSEPVPVSVLIPSEGVFDDYTLNWLYLDKSELFVPNTLEEGVCAVKLMLNSDQNRALQQGVESYQLLVAAGELPDLELLYGALRVAIKELYISSRQSSFVGVLSILIRMETQFGIGVVGRVVSSNSIENYAAETGIDIPEYVIDWVFLHYLETFGVDGFDISPLIEQLKLD